MSKLGESVGSDHLGEVTEFVKKHGKLYSQNDDTYKKEPFALDIRAGKVSLVYNAHSYHTKVPLEGIEPFVLNYTEVGDLVLDPFCGSGMTGLAAIKHGRLPILIELSPAAAFIAKNYCSPIDLEKFDNAAREMVKNLKDLANWLYETTCRICGQKAILEYVILSDEIECPRCSHRFLLFHAALDKKGDVKKEFDCQNCGRRLKKTDCKKTGIKPARVNYTCPRCKRREADANEFDTAKIQEIERRWHLAFGSQAPSSADGFWPIDIENNRLWFPDYPMMFKGTRWGDTWRAGYHSGITNVYDFFTTRNLWFLSAFWDLINHSEIENEIKEQMRFAFTSTITISSKMGRYGKRTGNISGTLYVPSLIKDMNAYRLLQRKIWGPRGIYRAFRELARIRRSDNDFIVSVQSSTNLSNIPDNSIDYVFTDPPFGGNLMYSELNFIWESWLRDFTNVKEEAIINESQGKGISEYKALMSKSFDEVYRVLKPGRWMTMVFHNSDGRVWQAIQEGLSQAGFVIGMIGIFDKKQRSFKQVTSTGAVGYDVVVNCYKPKASIKNGIEGKTTKDAIIGFLADQLQRLPLINGDERTARMLHSKTIGFFMLQSSPLENLSFEDFQRILKKNFRSIDGYWYLPYQRPKLEGQKKLFGYISTEAEAIEWLEELLRVPRKHGDITPEFFKALGPHKLQKDLQDLLQENFVEEKGIWRNPTIAEKERLIKRLTDKTARQINEYLKGTMEHTPTETELCEWIEFCYNNGLYQEAADLFHHINEKGVAPELFQKAKKIAEVCKLKAWEWKQE